MPYLQRTYTCVLRFKGLILHAVPLAEVTRDELKLIAFLHGADAVAELRFIGEREVVARMEDTADGPRPVFVTSQMDEFRRLARKYDSLVNSGRGQRAVEDCFKTRIIDLDSVVEEVDAVDAVERRAAEADAKAEIQAAAKRRAEVAGEGAKPESDPAQPTTGAPANFGAGLFNNRNKAS